MRLLRYTSQLRRTLFAIAFIIILIIAFELLYRNRIYPRVRACDTSIGGQTIPEAAASLRPCSIHLRFRTVVLQTPRTPLIRVLAHDLGYTFDGSWTGWRAFETGRRGAVWQQAITQISAVVGGVDVPLGQQVDQNSLRHYLFMIAAGVNKPPTVRVPGRNLNVAVAQQRITHLLLTRSNSFSVSLPVVQIYATAHVHYRGHLDRKHRNY